ncbi:MAG: T9SS type A sorting domain-containing protein [Flavobacteriaceae bacterium]
MIKKLLYLAIAVFSLNSFAQTTYVPDDNFEQELINLGYDTVLDDYVVTANIAAVQILDIQGKNIADLTGIEDFSGLLVLNCFSNQLINLNVSQNAALSSLNCNNNLLENLNVQNGNNSNFVSTILGTDFSATNNPNLTCIKVDDIAYSTANWSSIDAQSYFATDCGLTFVPDNNFEQALIDLGLDSGVLDDQVITSNISSITSLNVSNKNITDLTGIEDFIALTTLICSNNQLTNIDISQNIALDYFDCNLNQLTSLDITQNTALTLLACRSNQITSLDLSNNSLLEYFSCHTNLLTDLDVSQNPALVRLWCYNNQLTSLNVKNGANTNILNSDFDTTNNPNLNCIQIDDLAYSTTNWTNIDAASSFSEDCNATYVPDDNFEQALIDLGLDSGALDNYVTNSNINTITFLNVSNKNITDLTGIEGFTMLQDLSCYDNQLTSFNVTANLHLTDLLCFNNQLTSLDVSNNSNLSSLRCEDNLLTSLNVSQNTALQTLRCQNNQIASLDLSLNTSLYRIWCENNELTALNMRNGNNTNTSSLNFKATGNPNLYCINVDDLAYSTSNWSTRIDPQSYFSEDCNATYVPDDNFEQALIDLGYDSGALDNYVTTVNINTVTSLDVSFKSIADLTGIEGFVALTDLQCNNNQLTSLDISQNTLLTNLVCSNNSLGSLDVSLNIALTNLSCQNTDISNIDLSQNVALTDLNIKNNLLTSLDVSQNTILDFLDCRTNQITVLDVSNNTSLTSINCNANELLDLDITNNPSITFLNTSSNLLESLNMANGNNTIITTFFATGNSNLNCINVDDVAWSTANWTSIDTQSFFATDCNVTYVPNDNFEQALIDLGYDTGALDDYVPTVNVENLTGLDVSGKSISDLTGIEVFTALTFLDCSNNLLTNLDVTQNTALTYLNCFNNQLTGLDVTQNIALTNLILPANQLASLDVTQNVALTGLNLSDNQLTSLNVTQNIALTTLGFDNNQLPSIDVTLNTALTSLFCDSNLLINLDVTQNTALTFLSCKSNVLTSLNVVQNTVLTTVKCENNQLTSLNLKNGNNTSITSGNFRATNNPDLICIEVDNAAWSTTNWITSIDAQSYFSEDCSLSVDDFDMESYFTIYPNPVKDSFSIQNNSSYTIDKIAIYNMLGKLVYQTKNTQSSIKVNDLSNGIYFVKLTSNNLSIMKKIIVKN